MENCWCWYPICFRLEYRPAPVTLRSVSFVYGLTVVLAGGLLSSGLIHTFPQIGSFEHRTKGAKSIKKQKGASEHHESARQVYKLMHL